MRRQLWISLSRGLPIEPAGGDPHFQYYAVKGIGNAVQLACEWMVQNPNDPDPPVVKKFPPVEGPDHTLILLGGVIYWRTPKVVVRPEEILEGGEAGAFRNADADWLTFETVLNKLQFRKTNQARRIGLYAAEMGHLQIWVRDKIPPDNFSALCEALFPDHSEEEVRRLSEGSWWWKTQPDLAGLAGKSAPYRLQAGARMPPAEPRPARLPESAEILRASRARLRIHLPRYAFLPYNFWDNDLMSNALGTNPLAAIQREKPAVPAPARPLPPAEGQAGGAEPESMPKHVIPLIQVKNGVDDAGSWKMWRTASRSCVMELARAKPAGEPWPDRDWAGWDFDAAKRERQAFRNQGPNPKAPPYVSTAFRQEVQQGNRFHLRDRTPHHFSVKTGVCYVGFDRQEKANKDVIGKDDEWFVGCLRSDTIQAMDVLMNGHGGPRRDILIQTEVAMILERKPAPGMEKVGVDGMALRDLAVLETARYYIPPLSIPFIARDMKTLTEEFVLVDDASWRAFWKRNWAEALGRAKALFLVQYGMQHSNPNVQNYLLEFPALPDIDRPDGQPVRVVIRDVADALVVREVMWALFGEDRECPGEPGGHAQLRTSGLPVLRFNFRNAAGGKQNETGSTDEQFGAPGIQFLWQRFSTFYGAQKEKSKLLECPPARLPAVLRLMCEWLTAHSAAYVRTVEQALGVEFGAIAWHELLTPAHSPARFQDGLDLAQYEQPAKDDLQWEETAARVLTDYFRNDGRQKLCDYHNRGWNDAPAAFTVRVVDYQERPVPLAVLRYQSHDRTMRGERMTDAGGRVPFFSKAAADFDFELWRADPAAADGLSKVRLTQRGADLVPSAPEPEWEPPLDPLPESM